MAQKFTLEADDRAQSWLVAHPSDQPLVIAYDVHRCCGGGGICQVTIRRLSRKDDRTRLVTGVLDGGATVLIDPRAASRLPSRFGLTVRGLGPLRHLDLELDGEQWGQLLYS